MKVFHTYEVAAILFSYKDYISRVTHYFVYKCSVTTGTDKNIMLSVKHIVSYIFFTWTYLEPYLCTKHLESISNFWIKPIVMTFDGIFPITFTEPLVVTQWTPRKLQRNNCEFH